MALTHSFGSPPAPPTSSALPLPQSSRGRVGVWAGGEPKEWVSGKGC